MQYAESINGVKIPWIALGMYQIPENEDAQKPL